MYEDIFELVTIAAQKRNLKESTAVIADVLLPKATELACQ